MKAMEKDWYQKNWTLDIQNMSWVEDTGRQVDFLIKQLQLKGTEKILDLACSLMPVSSGIYRLQDRMQV